MTDTTEAAGDAQDDGWDWAIVEIMGHRKHVGRIREEERFSTKMLRVDAPNNGNPAACGWTTHHYAGSALFGFTLTDEATALAYNRLTASRDAEIDADDAEPSDDNVSAQITADIATPCGTMRRPMTAISRTRSHFDV